jgi:D-alanyl-D-alanine carboxypeptidase (penicillin-binding protein 5/6)
MLALNGVSLADTPTPAPACRCRAAVLMDAATGQVLYQWHAYRQMDPASITKIMTAYLVIRHGDLGREVIVGRRAAATPGSRMHLREGQRYTVLDLLRGLLLRSGNDAAVQLAEADAGSVPRFVAEMNRTARALGAYNTHFANPNGLTAPGHYSSAYDLALIARAALRLPLFQHLVSTREDWVEERTRGTRRDLYNTNRLLETFPAADGIKTGTTDAAGRCLAASATEHGVQLIAVVLYSRDRWDDAARLLAWGFQAWKAVQVFQAGQPLASVEVRSGVARRVSAVALHPVVVMVPQDAAPVVVTAVEQRVRAPVARHAWLGMAYVAVGERPVAGVPLVAAAAVRRSYSPRSLWQRLWDWVTGRAAG